MLESILYITNTPLQVPDLLFVLVMKIDKTEIDIKAQET